jgi:hypothetical protein
MWNLFKKNNPVPDIEVGDLLGSEVVIEASLAMDLEKGWWTRVTTETIEGNNHVYESWIDNSRNERIYRKSEHYDSTYNKTDSEFKVFKK